jgi:hypothetical protein
MFVTVQDIQALNTTLHRTQAPTWNILCSSDIGSSPHDAYELPVHTNATYHRNRHDIPIPLLQMSPNRQRHVLATPGMHVARFMHLPNVSQTRAVLVSGGCRTLLPDDCVAGMIRSCSPIACPTHT